MLWQNSMLLIFICALVLCLCQNSKGMPAFPSHEEITLLANISAGIVAYGKMAH